MTSNFGPDWFDVFVEASSINVTGQTNQDHINNIQSLRGNRRNWWIALNVIDLSVRINWLKVWASHKKRYLKAKELIWRSQFRRSKDRMTLLKCVNNRKTKTRKEFFCLSQCPLWKARIDWLEIWTWYEKLDSEEINVFLSVSLSKRETKPTVNMSMIYEMRRRTNSSICHNVVHQKNRLDQLKISEWYKNCERERTDASVSISLKKTYNKPSTNT